MTLIRLCIIAGCVPPTPVPIPPQSCGLGPCPHGYLGPTHMGTPVKHAVHHPCIPRCEAVGHFGTFTLPRRHPLGLERHPQDPGPSGDFAWLLLAQSQRGSLPLPGPSPQTPLHRTPTATSLSHQGHCMCYHHGRPLLSACHPQLHPYAQHSHSTPVRPPTPTSPRRVSHHHLPGQVTGAHTGMS